LVNTCILVSSAVLGSMSIPGFKLGMSFFSKLFTPPTERVNALVADRPRIVSEGGWTTIYCDNIDAFSEWLGHDEQGIPPRPGEEPSLGSHLLVELYGCSSEALQKESYVGEVMRAAAHESKATVVEQSFHEFKPYGVSGAVIIQESHYTIHTWPEHRYAAVDLFYCGGTVLVHRAIEVLNERFQPERIKFLIVRRGIQSEVERPTFR
jgi:S-adenosylmethionine decarboxylase